MARPKFPFVVKRGSATVKVYYTPTKGCDSFTISFWVGGKRQRRTFSTFEKAKFEAEKAANQLTTGDLDVLMLKSEDRAAYLRALKHLEPVGVPIETATAEFAEAKKQLGGVSLSRAVEYYLQNHPVHIQPHRVPEVIKECLEAKESDGLSEVYLRGLRGHFKKFAEAFPGNIGDVSGNEMDQWLRSLSIGPRSRNNHRKSLQTLFSFAKSRKYLPKDNDEIDAVGLAKQTTEDIEIFTPAEMKLVLSKAPEDLIPFLTLGAFAGIRHAEILRLAWNDVRFRDGIIEIRPEKAKTASRRTIPILRNLREWLKPYWQEDGPVHRGKTPSFAIQGVVDEIQQSAKHKEFGWKHNGLRHSFISYRVAETQNVAQVALEAGNSPQVIFRNYRELVTPKAAEDWFNISPCQ